MRFGLALAAAAALFGQEPSGTAIRTTAYLVEVTVVASMRSGETARGLTAGDVRVWDNGREQSLASFARLDSRAPLASRLASSGRPQILSAILLDALNTSWKDQAVVRRELLRTLAQVRPDERVGIFVLGNGLRVLHDFSSDPASLLAKVGAYRGGVPVGTAEEPSAADWPFSAELSYERLFPVRAAAAERDLLVKTRKILDTLGALESIAGAMGGIPGRKNLLWISAGFSLALGTPDLGAPGVTRIRTFGQEMDRAQRALSAANVAVYPIDARGLFPGNPYINVAAMREIAEETGGRAYYNRNDIHSAVREALDDSREVYLLSYSPRPFAEDGSMHRIRVAAARPGVTLRYRRGYFAPAGE